jgi:Domain of unknown function (DUF5122) beta-propeller
MRKTIVLGVLLSLIQIPLIALVLVQEITWGGIDRERASGVAAGPGGSVYVTGVTRSFGAGGEDAFLLKFAANGSLEWQRTYGTAPDDLNSGSELGRGVAVAADGAVYVTGNYRDGNLFLAKFLADGSLEWQQTWGDAENVYSPSNVEIGAGGVYVAGFTGSGGGDAFLVKFDPASGAAVWQRTWGGDLFDVADDLAIGADGGIYIAGSTQITANDAFLVKFTSDGDLAWQREWGIFDQAGEMQGLTAAFGVGTAPDGSVYITGNTFSTGNLRNIILVKFDADGAVLWEKVGGPGSGAGTDVAVSPDGNVHVTGNVLAEDPNANSGSAFVATFLSNGKGRDAAIWGGDPTDFESESGVRIDVASDGALVVAGAAGAPPYTFIKGSKSVKTPAAFLVTPAGTVATPAAVVGTANGIVGVPNGSLTYAGESDAALLRIQP